mmetsp:Transcript_3479/g.6360  ORF Transcript_3479/g.6360 Transcript_3479/m.6360 type:complete len:238 (+) Transcript_3479:201-914(+)
MGAQAGFSVPAAFLSKQRRRSGRRICHNNENPLTSSLEIIPANSALFQHLAELRLLAKPARKFSAAYETNNKAASLMLQFFVQMKPGDPRLEIHAIGFIIDVETIENAEYVSRLCQERFDLQDARPSIPFIVHAFDLGDSSDLLMNYLSSLWFNTGTPMGHILAKHGFGANDRDGNLPTTLLPLFEEMDKNGLPTFFARISEGDKDGNEIQRHLVWFVSDTNMGSLEKQLRIKMRGV